MSVDVSPRNLKCEVCGVPWELHTEGCPRHQLRYLHECRGHGRNGLWQCCPRAGVEHPSDLDACPARCPCHKRLDPAEDPDQVSLGPAEVFPALKAWQAPAGWSRRVLADMEQPVAVVVLSHPDEGSVQVDFGGRLTRGMIRQRLDRAVGRFLEAKKNGRPGEMVFRGHPDPDHKD